MELVVAMKPHIQARLRPYLEQEYALLAGVLYLTAAATGFRADALAHLTPADFARPPAR